MSARVCSVALCGCGSGSWHARGQEGRIRPVFRWWSEGTHPARRAPPAPCDRVAAELVVGAVREWWCWCAGCWPVRCAGNRLLVPTELSPRQQRRPAIHFHQNPPALWTAYQSLYSASDTTAADRDV